MLIKKRFSIKTFYIISVLKICLVRHTSFISQIIDEKKHIIVNNYKI